MTTLLQTAASLLLALGIFVLFLGLLGLAGMLSDTSAVENHAVGVRVAPVGLVMTFAGAVALWWTVRGRGAR
jgi:hypothetical protein